MNITAQELTNRATARVSKLIDVTLDHAGYQPTEDERRLVTLGANLGIASTIAELSHPDTDQTDVPEYAISAEDARRYGRRILDHHG